MDLADLMPFAYAGEEGDDDDDISHGPRPPASQAGSPRTRLRELRSSFNRAAQGVPVSPAQAAILARAAHRRPHLRRLRDLNECQLGPGLPVVAAMCDPSATHTNEVVTGRTRASQTAAVRILAPAEVAPYLVGIAEEKGQYVVMDREAVETTAFLHKVVTGGLYKATQDTGHVLVIRLTFGAEPVPFCALFPCAALRLLPSIIQH